MTTSVSRQGQTEALIEQHRRRIEHLLNARRLVLRALPFADSNPAIAGPLEAAFAASMSEIALRVGAIDDLGLAVAAAAETAAAS